ncbi:hypothetical protein [Rosenbergiella epipactidis]|uniref:hypothetical protein n=1 Tax=Rosenbergiella epipactidis TaxID=1544694 RepID=UPI001F4D6BFD|nr:hypothetical protein [Rosenbergiella epipactidis]
MLMSVQAFAESAEQSKEVSTYVEFGGTTTFDGNIIPTTGLAAGTTPAHTVIATVGVVNGGGTRLIGNDPNDTDATNKAPDQGWTMKSDSAPDTKMVKVKVDDTESTGFISKLGGRLWNKMPAGSRASIITNGQQDIIAGDDYKLTETIAKYVP